MSEQAPHTHDEVTIEYPPGSVTPQCVVALTWTMQDGTGETLDVLDEPVEFLVGGDDLLAAIEDALQGKLPGTKLQLHLEPEHAFGEYDEALVFLEDRSKFPDLLESGMVFDGLPPGCNPDAPPNVMYMVDDIYPDHVVMDGNHPLSGMALRLQVKIEAVREATVDEVGRGGCGAGFFTIAPTAPGNDLLH